MANYLESIGRNAYAFRPIAVFYQAGIKPASKFIRESKAMHGVYVTGALYSGMLLESFLRWFAVRNTSNLNVIKPVCKIG